jgi:hypothetical protein
VLVEYATALTERTHSLLARPGQEKASTLVVLMRRMSRRVGNRKRDMRRREEEEEDDGAARIAAWLPLSLARLWGALAL